MKALDPKALVVFLPLAIGFGIGQICPMKEEEDSTTYVRPAIQPPNAVFPVVWTILYLILGIILYRLWTNKQMKMGQNSKALKLAMGLFLAQLVLNYSYVVAFGCERDLMASLYILLGLLAVVMSLGAVMSNVDWVSTALLGPYLAWLGFALQLNVSIVEKNAVM